MKKVAVINRTNLKNYGSVLQCYALCKSISDMGYDSEIIWVTGNVSKNFDFRPVKIISSLFKLITHPSLWKSTFKTVKEVNAIVISEEIMEKYDEFVSQEITQTLYSQKELREKAKSDEYYKFVCGSDQIWCSTTLYVDPLMYLQFAPKEKRIAYAPSIGRDFIPNYNRRIMKKFISEIPSVSIREEVGRELIKSLIDKDVPVVVDPTLLIAKENWDFLKRKYETERKYILCYFLDIPSKNTQHRIAKTAKEKGLTIVALYNQLRICEEEDCNILYLSAGPREFLGLIEDAEMVITDSYHGMLFSIIYQKKFWSIERAYTIYDQSSRQRSLLTQVNLMDRYLIDSVTTEIFDDSIIDYSKVDIKIKEFQQNSLIYLRNSLES